MTGSLGRMAVAGVVGYVGTRGFSEAWRDVAGTWRALGASIAALTTLCDYRIAEARALDPVDAARARSDCHARGAARARAVCEASGGLYLKAGQLVSSMAGLPNEYACELSRLTDFTPALPFATVRSTLQSELGAPLSNFFQHVDDSPLASGSLAVVHLALLLPNQRLSRDTCNPPSTTYDMHEDEHRLHPPSSLFHDSAVVDGDELCTEANVYAFASRTNSVDDAVSTNPSYRSIGSTRKASTRVYEAGSDSEASGGWVALKVQRPNLGRQLSSDLGTIRFVLTALASFGGVDVRFIVPELRQWLVQELNFETEARSAEVIRDAFKDDNRVTVPRVYEELSTSKVLTMEYIDGCRADDLDCIRDMNLKPANVASIVSDTFGRMFTCIGLVHGDAHPGNLRVRRNPANGSEELCLLDHGLYVELEDELRHEMCRFWRAIALQNQQELEDVGIKIGAGRMLSMLLSGQRQKVALQANDVTELMQSLPRETGALLRANGLANSLVKKLAEGDREIERQRLFAMARYAILGLQGQESRPAQMLPWNKWLKWQARSGFIEARFRVLQAALRASSRITAPRKN